MPHKRNPILCERICGLARVLRGYAMTAMEDVALWHERDISHSSAERVILPDACALSDYIVRLSTRIVEGLRVKSENMASEYRVAWRHRVLATGAHRADRRGRVASRARISGSAGARRSCTRRRGFVPRPRARSTRTSQSRCPRRRSHIVSTSSRIWRTSTRPIGVSVFRRQQHSEHPHDASAPVLAIEAGLAGGRMS